MSDKFAKHKQPWKADEVAKLRTLAAKGKGSLVSTLVTKQAATAARFVPPLGRWRRVEPGRAAIMRAELERIAGAQGLSRDTFEQVTRSLD